MAPTRYFLSYARADHADVNRFNEVFIPQLATSTQHNYERWMDTDILPGEDWNLKIQAALAECRFGVLLVSPNFLTSKYITEIELAALLAKPMVVPIALHPILFNGVMNLKGLAERQVFRGAAGRSFDQCGRKSTRRAFVLDLHQKIEALLLKAA
jgi:hypothetical protein